MTGADSSIATWEFTPASLERFFASGQRTKHLVSEEPRLELVIDASRQAFEVQVLAVGSVPDLTGMERVKVETRTTKDGQKFILTIDAAEMHAEAYGIVMSVVESMRAGSTFAVATRSALRHLRALLEQRRRMTEQAVIGLWGELFVLRDLVDALGPGAALEAWKGPQGEEHDFSVTGVDLEVKTTLRERRQHVISGATQLQPSPGRGLWLLSVQVTRAGGAEGLSLPTLVRQLQTSFTDELEAFDGHLADVGWASTDASFYANDYLLRSKPAFYMVDDNFPAITPPRLHQAVPMPERIDGVVYTVDVTDLPESKIAAPLDRMPLNFKEVNSAGTTR